MAATLKDIMLMLRSERFKIDKQRELDRKALHLRNPKPKNVKLSLEFMRKYRPDD